MAYDTTLADRPRTGHDDPERARLLESARALVPALRERAGAAEAARRMAEETHRAFVEAGFYRVLQPRRWGGLEMDFAILVDLAAELGRGCGSSAWVFTNIAIHGLINGMKPPLAQEELWGDDPGALVASAHPSREATVRAVDGGLVVDGAWNYASGIDFADWINLQIFLRPEGGPAEHRFAMVPKSDARVVDDWFVTGLAATGSRTVVLEEVFIPGHRMISSLQMGGGETPGSAVNPGVLYRLPFWGVGAKLFSGPQVGLARGAQELMEGDIESRVSVGGAKLAEQPTVLARLAESGGETEAAWAVLTRDCAAAEAMAARGEAPSVFQRAAWRRNNAFAIQLCLRAVDRLYALSGMRGMLPDSAIQRCWRDAHAAASQVAIAWDTQAVNYGRARFGLPLTDPRV